ncbi:zinc finger C2HC domain-containing protein 1C [Seriola dumerili]|uniref:zinc finger C2HC domain-containing protein 1C n=1 Tax=Seriola dumerili TaxID=41447 RepID=UPI000BBF2B1F|nr:zinc finger C2HC domain-containing protein 1C [Seriola dumerili]
MSTYTRRSLSPHGQHDIPGQRQGNVYTQVQHGRRADGVGRPFPNKPVSHRRPLNSRTQDSLDLYDFEKITITKQQRGSFLPQEHNLNDIRKTTGSQHTRKDSHRLPSGELQMARAIHAKELMLQEKLWRVEEVIRQKIQRDSVAVAAGNDEMTSEKEMHDGGQAERGKAHTKTKLSEQHRREALRSGEILIRPHKEKLGLMNSTDTNFQLLPCTICNRKFKSDRLEKHVHICKKVSRSHRQVFNSYVNRTKGSAIEEFWKTHSRSKTPEVLQEKSKRQNHKVYTKGRLPAGSSQQKLSK